MLGAEIAVAECARLREARATIARGLVEIRGPSERRVDEALVRCLLRHTQRRADLGPGATLGAGGLDVAVEQVVAQPAQLVRGVGRGTEPSSTPDAASASIGADSCWSVRPVAMASRYS